MGESPFGFKFPEVIHSTHDVACRQCVPWEGQYRWQIFAIFEQAISFFIQPAAGCAASGSQRTGNLAGPNQRGP